MSENEDARYKVYVKLLGTTNENSKKLGQVMEKLDGHIRHDTADKNHIRSSIKETKDDLQDSFEKHIDSAINKAVTSMLFKVNTVQWGFICALVWYLAYKLGV